MRGSSGRGLAGVGAIGAVEMAVPTRKPESRARARVLVAFSSPSALEPPERARRFVPGRCPAADSEWVGCSRVDPGPDPAAARPTARPVRAAAADADRAAELAPAAIADRPALSGIAGETSTNRVIQVRVERLRLPRSETSQAFYWH